MARILILLSLYLGTGAPAQAGYGTLAGQVVDQTGAVLPGVTVGLVAETAQLTTTSDGAGRYVFERVPVGRVELTYRLLNFTVLRRIVLVEATPVALPDVTMILSLTADVVVTGRATFRNLAEVERPSENLVGIAAAASQGAVTAEQLTGRPFMRAGEVLETVPGMIVSQHSGEGKANQYYLRGFNLDHGTDFSTTVAGVPVNTPTGAHAQGYADASFLIPELVSGIQFEKGPYFADQGDFSAAGAANINYVNQLDRPVVSASAGNDGWGRVFAAASPRTGRGHLLAAIEWNHNDGPWLQGNNYRKGNLVVRYSQGDRQNSFSVTGMGYWADWRATDQIPVRAIDNGAIDRLGQVDPSDKGVANRQSVAIDVQRALGGGSLRGTGFVLHNRLNLFSNFTYFLDDPVNGDQFEQAERRVATGGRVTYRRLGHLASRHVESLVGVQVRHDNLSPVGLYRTLNARRLWTTREDQVSQTMTGVFGQTEIEWTRTLRTTFGLRTDAYRFDVTSDHPLNSGHGADALVSPKVGAVFGPWAATEIYANAGTGFHSNDARGAVISVDPVTGNPVERVTPLVRAKGAEVGVRTVRIRGLQSTLSVWYLGIDSELLFVGDAGTTEAGRPSRRVGMEWSNYVRLRPWLTLEGDLAFTRARFTDDDAAGHWIPGALARVISGGVTVEPSRSLSGSLRVRHFGPRALVEDKSVSSDQTTLWNGEIGYRVSPKARIAVEVFNLFNARASDIDYFYTSRLPGESRDGVNDVHTHPAVPRSARVAFQVIF